MTISTREFIDSAKMSIPATLPVSMAQNLDLEAAEVVKLNDQILHGITFRRKDLNMGPTFYVDGLVEAIETNNADPEEAIRGIADQYLSGYADYIPEKVVEISENIDFTLESIRPNLTASLVEIKRNQRYLSDKPYLDMGCGLALIATINRFPYSISVTDSIAENAGLTKDDLFSSVLENAPVVSPAKLTAMEDELFGDKKNLLNGEPLEKADGIYVLSNKDSLFGAAAMFYPGILEKAREILGEGFFILPSSIHEVILVPDSGGVDVSTLSSMVREANRSVVDPCELLSDHVFHYGDDLKIVG